MKNKKQRDYLEKYKSIIKDRKTGHVLLAAVLAGSLSACGTNMQMFDKKDLRLEATEAGVQAWFDGLANTALVAKRPEDISPNNPHYVIRSKQVDARTERTGYRYGAHNLKSLPKLKKEY